MKKRATFEEIVKKYKKIQMQEELMRQQEIKRAAQHMAYLNEVILADDLSKQQHNPSFSSSSVSLEPSEEKSPRP